MKNTKWIIFFIILTLVCFFVLLIFWHGTATPKIARIIQDGKVIREIDLENVAKPYEFTVSDGNGGHNTIRVENGRIGVVSADCPDKVCVNQGYIKTGATPIVCLPHKLCIVIVSQDNVDAVVGAE